MENMQAAHEQEVKEATEDTSNVDWDDLTNRVFEEINHLRKDPKFLIK